MATLTIKNVPEPLVERLKVQAALHRRSLNAEIIVRLEGVQTAPLDVEARLARIRAVRGEGIPGLTDRRIRSAVRAGRK
jgi:antitoxin FitA